jgi:hypothetical protein
VVGRLWSKFYVTHQYIFQLGPLITLDYEMQIGI